MTNRGNSFTGWIVILSAVVVILASWTIATIPINQSHPLVLGAGGVLLVIIVLHPHIGVYVMIGTLWLSTLFPAAGGLTLNRVVGLATLAGIVLPWTMAHRNKKKYKLNEFDYLFFGFLGVILLSILVNDIYPRTSGIIWELLMGYVLYWIICNTIDNRSRLRTILWIIVVSTIVIALFIISEFLAHQYSASATRFGGIHQYNTAGAMIALSIIIVLWLFELKKGKKQSLFGVLKYGVILLLVGAMFLTGNRSGFVALLTSLFTVGIFSSRSKGKQRVLFAIGLIILSGFIIASVAPATVDRVVNIPVGILSRATTAGELNVLDRVQINRGAWRMFIFNPVLGVGFGGFGYNLWMYAPERPGSTSVAHNIFTSTMAETGTVGLVIFLAIFGTFFLRMWKNIRSAHVLKNNELDVIYALALFVGVSVDRLFHGVTIDRIMFVVFALGTSVLKMAGNSKDV